MTMNQIIEDRISCKDGTRLAYRRLLANPSKQNKSHMNESNKDNAAGIGKEAPGVVFLGGYMSDMMGTKASFLEDFCETQGLAFVRFDYYAHGASDGAMEDATIGRWKEDALCVIDNLTEGPQILIGSSLGGWIMLLAALARKDRIKGLIGIAPAVDFVDHLIGISSEQEADLEKLGYCYIQHKGSGHTVPLPKRFVEDARSHGLLPLPSRGLLKLKESKFVNTSDEPNSVISLQCPVRIIHGMQDNEVPWQHSIKLIGALKHDAMLTLIKESNHRLSRPEDLHILSNLLIEMVKL